MDSDERRTVIVFAAVGMLILACACGIFWAWPQYNVYRQTLAGEAQLKEAQYTRQISELDAQAAVNKAKGDAQAEIERAKGAAKANEILADSLNGKEDYLRYLYINALREGNNREIIYVPTNGLLPITEAGRGTVPEPAK